MYTPQWVAMKPSLPSLVTAGNVILMLSLATVTMDTPMGSPMPDWEPLSADTSLLAARYADSTIWERRIGSFRAVAMFCSGEKISVMRIQYLPAPLMTFHPVAWPVWTAMVGAVSTAFRPTGRIASTEPRVASEGVARARHSTHWRAPKPSHA